MKLLAVVGKFPKWVLVGSVILGSSAVFLLWWSLRRSHAPGTEAPASVVASGAKLAPESPVSTPRKLPAFNLGDVILCGNTLVNLHSGEILTREWILGFGERVPSIVKILPEESLVIVTGDRGLTGAFDFDGNPKPLLQVDGRPVGPCAFHDSGRELLFVRDGNLWRGKIDWVASQVEAPKRITDTGYFREDVFRGQWLWHDDTLMVTNLGRALRVNLSSGKVEPDRINFNEVIAGLSPDHDLVLIPAGRSDLGVYEFSSGEAKTLPCGQHVNGILWLDRSKAVVQIGPKQLGLYDHGNKSLDGLYSASEAIRTLTEPSPDGRCFTIVTTQGAGVIDVKERKFTPFEIAFDEVEWISNEAMLASSSATSSEQRGMWLIQRSGKSERLMNQPVDASNARGQAVAPLLPSGHFVLGGELWICEPSSGKITQITHGGKLLPYLLDLHL